MHLSRELDATRDAMKRLLLNGTGSNENPTPARRPGAKRPQSSGRKMVVTAQVEETILALLQSFRPAHDPSRQNGVRSVTATCEACNHQADVNVDPLPESVTVPKAGKRLRCSSCGGKTISTRPAWRRGSQRSGVPDYRPIS